ISRPRSSCHSSNCHPRLLQVSRTFGQPVEIAASGLTRCLASSAKRLIGRVSDDRELLVLHGLSSLDESAEFAHLNRERLQVGRSRLVVVERRLHAGELLAKKLRLNGRLGGVPQVTNSHRAPPSVRKK